jgi:hypothetical protein
MITFIPPAEAKQRIGALVKAKAGMFAGAVGGKVDEAIDELYSSGTVIVDLQDSENVRKVVESLGQGKKISFNA